MKLYGIASCDTVKKARDWLTQNDITVTFHDYKKHGLDAATAQAWLQQVEWQTLINRKGLTWRGLDEARKLQIVDNASALALMLEKTSVIKRPVLIRDATVLHIGFDAESYSKIFTL
jgi:Spx/MgsR family transcriptional regulator